MILFIVDGNMPLYNELAVTVPLRKPRKSNMQANITADFVKKLTPEEKPFEVWDSALKGFIVRVQPSGIKTYLVEYARHKRITIGQISAISASDARKEAAKRIADYIHGNDPMAAKKAAQASTFEEFVRERYAPWINSHQKRPKETLRLLALFYPYFGNRKLAEIDAGVIERFRSARLKKVKPNSVNHDITALRAALNRAIDWGLLKEHPMRTVKKSKVDSNAKIRYLSPDESRRLREAMNNRELNHRAERERFNQWRKERGYEEYPDFGTYTDHLKPMVLLALNTGMRRGELFDLKWEDVNFAGRILTVVGETAKSGKTRHIPLNDEALSVLRAWYEQRKESERVFPNADGGRLDNISTSWENLINSAQIKNFRFHDLRHDFASRLVMAGVDLNTVRELLGHSDIKMTLRYAHLAPEKLASAVAKLNTTN
jgi:integrase